MSTSLRVALLLGCAAILALEVPGAMSIVLAGDARPTPAPRVAYEPAPFGIAFVVRPTPRPATDPAAHDADLATARLGRTVELPPGMPGLAVTALR